MSALIARTEYLPGDHEPKGRVIFLLPGQGSQYPQMGRGLFDSDPVFRGSMEGFEAVLLRHGMSVLPLLYGEARRKDDPFQRTSETHPALFMLEVSLARTLMAQGIRPDVLLGSSLGEYAAAAVAGAVDADAMLLCLARCGRIIEERCPPGGMLAVFAPLDREDLGTTVTLAGVNAASHFVVSGPVPAIEALQARLAARGVLTGRVPVSHAFHSPDMDACAAEIGEVFAGLQCRPPRIPLVSCLTGAEITAFDADHFCAVGRHPIQQMRAVESLAAVEGSLTLVDIGPAGSLATLVRQAAVGRADWRPFAILSPFAGETSPQDRIMELKRSVAGAEPAEAVRASRQACIFPGQGAQGKGMGAELFGRFPDLVRQANDCLGYRLDELCLNDPRGELRDTRFTQPAVYLVNALAYLRHVEQTGRRPDFVAGHSLGEINALVAAEAVDLVTGLRMVQKRAELMAAAPPGGMAAVIGLQPDAIAEVLARGGFDQIDVANRNSPAQTVISGDLRQIEQAEAAFTKAGCKAYVKLPVGGAFHSRLMRDAETAFRRFLDQVTFRPPTIPVVSNVTARPYPTAGIADLLGSLVTKPVDWLGCVRHMLDEGVEDFVELGPKPVLTGMVRDIRAAWTPTPRRETSPPSPPVVARAEIAAETLGSAAFRDAYGLRYAYVCGGMVHGISSVDMVTRCARAGLLSFFGTGGLNAAQVEDAIRRIQSSLPEGAPYGFNLLNGSNERANVDLFLRHGVRNVEASAYIKVTPGLVLYRLRGLESDGTGVAARNRILAKLSRPEVAQEFLRPAPESLVRKLLDEGLVTPRQAELARRVPMADDICVEADSGGHTDQGVTAVLLPVIRRLRDAAMTEHGFAVPVRVGSGGGIGTPEAAVSALVLGADFVLTGSINQCTPEAGTSELVKDMLQAAEVQDTAYAPAGDMFELGARVQVLKRGVFFPARANRLYELYLQHDGLDAIDARSREQIEQKYFRRSFEEVWQDCLAYHPREAIERAERTPKQRMAYVFRWYFGYSNQLALKGIAERKVDFQVHCGPALGAFNQWVADSGLADWRARHVDVIAKHLMDGTAQALGKALAPYLPR